MSEQKALGILFTISTLLCMFSTSSFLISLNGKYSDDMSQTILITLFLSYFVCIFSFYKLILSKKQIKREIDQKEKNVKDYYQYNQLLNPPEIDN